MWAHAASRLAIARAASRLAIARAASRLAIARAASRLATLAGFAGSPVRGRRSEVVKPMVG
jgi:hypothetical protein